MDFAKTMFLAISAMGFFLWVGMIWKSDGEEKLEEACKPIHFVTGQIQELTTALVGYVPNWTVSFRRFMEGGCYYFFSIMLHPADDDSTSVGGVRAGGGVTGGVRIDE